MIPTIDDKAKRGDVYGATVCVLIRYDGTLEELAGTLATALSLKSFDVEATEDPPYEKMGTAEAFGWEAWLQHEARYAPYNFRFRMETEESIAELVEGRMYNLSPWFARLLTTLCDIEVAPA